MLFSVLKYFKDKFRVQMFNLVLIGLNLVYWFAKKFCNSQFMSKLRAYVLVYLFI